jgi:hypothetical protein
VARKSGASTGKNTGTPGNGNLRPPWKPGESGNPSGRPKNSIEAQTELRRLALGDVPDFYAALKAAALGKLDTGAIRLGIQLAGAMPDDKKPAGADPATPVVTASDDDIRSTLETH